MCRILRDLLQEGVVAKIADNLYCGGNSYEELDNWRRVLSALEQNVMKLSAPKIVCPKTCMILGWIWSNGTIYASPHRVATSASCDTPTTVKGLRSFIREYKVLAREISNCAELLSPIALIALSLESSRRTSSNSQT